MRRILPLVILFCIFPLTGYAQGDDPWAQLVPRTGFGYGGLLDLEWSPRNGQLAVRSETGIQYFSGDLTIEGERSLVGQAVGQVYFSPDMTLVALEEFGGLLVRDTRTWEPILALGEYGTPQWSNDSRYIAMWVGGRLRIWDVLAADVVIEITEIATDGASFKWSPDGKVIAIAGPGALALISVETGDLVRIHNYYSVTDFDWSADGRWLLVVGQGSEPILNPEVCAADPEKPQKRYPCTPPALNKLEKIDVLTGEVVYRYITKSSDNPFHSTGVGNSVSVSPDGRYVMADLQRWEPPYHRHPQANHSPGVGIWELESGLPVYDFRLGGGDLPGVANLVWSPDGTKVASASGDTVFVYDVRERRLLENLAAFIFATDQVVWVDAGEKVVAAGGLWNLDAGVPAYLGFAPEVPTLPSRSKPSFSFLNPEPALFDYSAPPYEWRVLQIYEDRGLILTYEIDIEYPGTPEYEDDIPPEERYIIWDIETQQQLEVQVNLGEQTAWLYDLPNAYERANGNTIFNIQRTTRFVSIGDDEIVDLRTGDVTLFDLNKWEFREVWFSPQGERIYTYDIDNRFKALDPVTGELLYQTVPVLRETFTYTPDLKKFTVMDEESTVYVYDAFTGELLLEAYTGNSYPQMLWDESFTYLAIGGDTRAVSLWSIPERRRVGLLRGHEGSIVGMAWNPYCDLADITQCRYVFGSSDSNGRVLLWGVESEAVIVQTLPEAPAPATLTPNPDVLNLDELEPVWTYVVENETYGLDEAYSVQWTDKGIYINGSYLYDVDLNLLPRNQFVSPPADLSGYVLDGNEFVSQGGEVVELQGASGRVTQRVGRNQVNDAAFNPDRTRIITAENIGDGKTGWLREWGRESGRQFNYWGGGAPPYNQVEWSRDGQWIVSATISTSGSGGRAQVWNAETHELTRSLIGHTGTISNMLWHPQHDNWLITASTDGSVRIWDIFGGELFRWQQEGGAPIVQFQLTKDRTGLLLTAGKDINLLNIDDLEEIRRWEGVGGRSFALSPDGTQLATIGADAVVRVVNYETGSSEHEERRHMPAISAIDWHPGGDYIALARRNGSIVYLDAENGGLDVILRPFGEPITQMEWNPAGDKLLIELESGELQVLDSSSGAVLLSLQNKYRRAGAWWSPDGQYVAFGTYPDPDMGVYTADSLALVFDLGTGQQTHQFDLDWDDYIWYWNVKPFQMQWSANSRVLVARYDGRVRGWEMTTGEEVEQEVIDGLIFDPGDDLRPDGEVVLEGSLIVHAESGFPLQYLDSGMAAWNPICTSITCPHMIAVVNGGRVTMFGFPQN